MKCPRCRKSQKCGSHSGKAEPFTVPITIRFTRADMRVIRRTAKQSRWKLAEWMRWCVRIKSGCYGYGGSVR